MKGTVALTGATGFIGHHLTRHLSREGWRLRVLSRRPGVEWPRAVTAVPGSLEDPGGLRRLVEGADAVVHCAGLVRAASAADFHAVNATGTGRLVEAVAGYAPRAAFLLVSSLAARAPTVSPYAASKHAGEIELMRRGGRLGWTILRPAAVYGPGDRATLGFFRQLRRGVVAVPGTGDLRVSLLYVEDLAAAVAALLAADPVDGSIFEVHDLRDGGYAWPEIVGAAERELDRRVLRLPLPRGACRVAAALNVARCALFGGVPFLTPGKVNELYHPDWVCRDDGLARRTGWRPEVEISAGFRRTLAWYRDRRWL